MFRSRSLALLCALIAISGFSLAQSQGKYPGIGRDATPGEIAAWDIDVRPDFKGLPPGSGSVAKGQEVWESKCASCHGVFGEANNVFSPLVGGTTADDIKTGRVARLRDPAYPGRTTLMKTPSLSTLWDYINRAMPWTQPKSLTVEEVYASTAFLLNLGGIVPDNFVLSDKNMADVQARLPNRNGMRTAHALWPGNEFGGSRAPDVKAVACMTGCSAPAVTSSFPDYALNAHGNLAQQNRLVGPQRGLDTGGPTGRDRTVAASASVTTSMAAVGSPSGVPPALAAPLAPPMPEIDQQAALALANRHTCTACHAMDQRTVGPGFSEIARKHAGRLDYLAGKIKAGGSGVWGAIPMPAQALSEADAKTLAAWLAAGAGK
jgi:S-disulfanyl-L-cysteine oxidoreductase SoxD